MSDFEMEVVSTKDLGASSSPENTNDKGDIREAADGSHTSVTRSKGQEKSRFGELPVDWKIHQLQDVVEVVGGSTPSTENEDYWGGRIPWATPTDVTSLRSTTIDGTADTITEEGLDSTSTHVLPAYSVLMTSRATIGACAVNTVPMATNQGFQSLVPGEELNTWYLYYRMRKDASYLESLGAGSTFDEISKRVVEKVEIPIPPLPEQRKIASVLCTVDKLIQLSPSEELKQLKGGLMQDLLTGEVRTADKAIEVLDEVAAHG